MAKAGILKPIEKKVLLFMKAPEKEAADNCAMDTPKVKDRQRIRRCWSCVVDCIAS